MIYSLLSRENEDSLKIDINFKNWIPPLVPLLMTFDKSFEPIKKIQGIATRSVNVKFGELNLGRDIQLSRFLFRGNDVNWAIHNRKYQRQFVKMMCNIAVSHSAHTISLAGLQIVDKDLALIINDIKDCNQSNLQHLDLSENEIEKSAAKSLSALLQAENTCLKTLQLNHSNISIDALNVISDALKNNRSLELIELQKNSSMPINHPILNDKRVKLTE